MFYKAQDTCFQFVNASKARGLFDITYHTSSDHSHNGFCLSGSFKMLACDVARVRVIVFVFRFCQQSHAHVSIHVNTCTGAYIYVWLSLIIRSMRQHMKIGSIVMPLWRCSVSPKRALEFCSPSYDVDGIVQGNMNAQAL